MPNIKIAPSILSADFAHLLDDVRAVEQAGADLLHVDVMDGHFVPNITMGPLVVKALQGKTRLPFDVHLMITDPDTYAPMFAKAGAHIISIQVESVSDIRQSIAKLKALEVRAAVVLNPDTPLTAIESVLDQVDMVLVMSVFPGFSGQKFMPEVLSKVRELRQCRPDLDIQIDGGINPETASLAIEAGANILVAGSAIYGSDDYGKAIREIRGEIDLRP